MKTLTVIIERTDNNYSAYLQEVDGIVATGKSVEEIKKCIIDSINVLIDECNEFGDAIPEALKGEYCLALKWMLNLFWISTQRYSRKLD